MADVDGALRVSASPSTSAPPRPSPVAVVHALAAVAPSSAEWRLRKHADYQRVYKSSRKHFSASMSYFFALRASSCLEDAGSAGASAPLAGAAHNPFRGPRVGLTAGKVLGNAVTRNRIKRRMREAVRKHVATLSWDVDVILHPRNFVATMDFAKLEAEVGRVFSTVQSALDRQGDKR